MTGRPANRLTLEAVIVEKSALRYTPAGLPALDLSLRHDSEVEQLGIRRKIGFEIAARAVGPIAESLQGAALGQPREFEGFVGGRRNGRGTLFHIERIV